VRFVNAGSVGLPYEGDGAARWLWVSDGVPELRQTAYDAVAAGARGADVPRYGVQKTSAWAKNTWPKYRSSKRSNTCGWPTGVQV
jgi:hypothetical protein